MRIRKALATGAVLVAAVGPVLAASTANAGVAPPPHNNWRCYGYGTGATNHDATVAANEDMVGDVTVGPWVYTGGQYADGTYWVQISADCTGVQ